jgi:hypothetical protein
MSSFLNPLAKKEILIRKNKRGQVPLVSPLFFNLLVFPRDSGKEILLPFHPLWVKNAQYGWNENASSMFKNVLPPWFHQP